MRKLRVALAALVAAFTLSAQAGYIADTGRSDKKEVSADSTVQLAGDSNSPIVQLDPKDLYFPSVEKALQNSQIAHLAVQSDGVNTSLKTFADIQVTAITGKSTFRGEDAIFTVLGMIYQSKLWVRVPMIPVESAKLADAFGLPKAKKHVVSAVWVMKTPKARELVMRGMGGSPEGPALDKDLNNDLKKFRYRIFSFINLTGEFKIVPLPNAEGSWVAPTQIENPDLAGDEKIAAKIVKLDLNTEPYASVMALHAALKQAFDEQKPGKIAGSVTAALANLNDNPDYMPPFKRTLDYWNTIIKPFHLSAILYLLAFLLFLAYLIRQKAPGSRVEEKIEVRESAAEQVIPQVITGTNPAMAMAGVGSMGVPAARPVTIVRAARLSDDPIHAAISGSARRSRGLWMVAFIVFAAAVFSLVCALITRFTLGGRMPVSNMYESLTFALGAFAIAGLVFEGVYRQGWVGIAVSFVGWMLMTLANSMPLHMRKIEPLVAVLNSVWLNFHVTSLLISYSLFLLAFVFSAVYLFKDITGNRVGILPRQEVFEYLTYRAIQTGWPLLTLGIFLGAVWANTAWGSYWSWDPKETWALITWLTYTIYLHLRMILGWTGRRSVYASMIGFVMVMITYFGVSYLPGLAGGMHSYAEPIAR
jgi:cytochrome c-type biogenesis protein CcsB